MILLELFNTPYHYRWLPEYDRIVAATFVAEDETTVRVEFAGLTGPDIAENGYEMAFERNGYRGMTSFAVTGQGDAYRVFATVGEILKEFMQKYKPDYLEFEAYEPSRVKLYKRMANKLAKQYNMELVHNAGDPGNHGDQVFLVKEKQ